MVHSKTVHLVTTKFTQSTFKNFCITLKSVYESCCHELTAHVNTECEIAVKV